MSFAVALKELREKRGEQILDEICECVPGKLLYDQNTSQYLTQGECRRTSICSHIARDSHRTKISTRSFILKKYGSFRKPRKVGGTRTLDEFLPFPEDNINHLSESP